MMLSTFGQMLETARKAIEKVRRKSRADFDADENLRLARAMNIDGLLTSPDELVVFAHGMANFGHNRGTKAEQERPPDRGAMLDPPPSA
jgi:hypothetical protein